MPAGFELSPPPLASDAERFAVACADLGADADNLIRLSQVEVDGYRVDTVDRIQVGADIVRKPCGRWLVTPDFSAELRAFVDETHWTFAKTMPEWPHEYIVRDRVDEQLLEQLVVHIRKHGIEGRFYEKRLIYYEEAGLVYWTMGAPIAETTIVNRCRSDDTYESRLANGTLP